MLVLRAIVYLVVIFVSLPCSISETTEYDKCKCILMNSTNGEVVLSPECTWRCMLETSNPLRCVLQTLIHCPNLAIKFISGSSFKSSQLLQFNHPTEKNDFHFKLTVTKDVMNAFSIPAEYGQMSVSFFPVHLQENVENLYNLIFNFDWAGSKPAPIEEEYWPAIEVPVNIRGYPEERSFGETDNSPYFYLYFNPPLNGSKPSCYEASCRGTTDINACNIHSSESLNNTGNVTFPFKLAIESHCFGNQNNEDPLIIHLPRNSAETLMCVECRVRGRSQYNDSSVLMTGSWSDPILVNTGFVKPPSKLLVSHADIWGYENQSLTYIIDVDGIFPLRARNSSKLISTSYVDYDSFGYIYSDKHSFCLDWIGLYKYTVELCGHQSCIIRQDYEPLFMESTSNRESIGKQTLYITSGRIENILCNPIQNTVIFTEDDSNSWKVKALQMASIQSNSIEQIEPWCNVELSSGAIAFDWKNSSKQFSIIFVVTNSGIQCLNITAYNNSCTITEVLSNVNFPEDTGTISLLESDWSYLYFSNGSSNIILYSWLDGTQEIAVVSFWDSMLANTQDYDMVSGFWPLVRLSTMRLYTQDARNFAPAVCIYPNVVFLDQPQMQSTTEAAVAIQVQWNDSNECKIFPHPPIMISISCFKNDIKEENKFACNVQGFPDDNKFDETRSDMMNFSLADLPASEKNIVLQVTASPLYFKAYHTEANSNTIQFSTNFMNAHPHHILYWPFLIVIIVFILGIGVLLFILKKRTRVQQIQGVTLIQSKDIKWDEYIGCGQFSEVWRGTLIQQKNSINELKTVVAIKQPKSDEAKKFLFQEAIIMAHLKHENIVQVLGICMHMEIPSRQTHNRIQKLSVLIFEYMNGESCSNYFVNNHKKLSLDSIFLVSQNILKACVYLQHQNYVHRDIAARNCLLEVNIQTEMIEKAKLADFGLARDMSHQNFYRPQKNNLFSRRSTAPEGWDQRDLPSIYSMKSDVWSFGIFLWELFTMRNSGKLAYPYEDVRPGCLQEAICTEKRIQDIPDRCPQPVYEIMKKCWKFEAAERPTFLELENSLFYQAFECVTQDVK